MVAASALPRSELGSLRARRPLRDQGPIGISPVGVRDARITSSPAKMEGNAPRAILHRIVVERPLRCGRQPSTVGDNQRPAGCAERRRNSQGWVHASLGSPRNRFGEAHGGTGSAASHSGCCRRLSRHGPAPRCATARAQHPLLGRLSCRTDPSPPTRPRAGPRPTAGPQAPSSAWLARLRTAAGGAFSGTTSGTAGRTRAPLPGLKRLGQEIVPGRAHAVSATKRSPGGEARAVVSNTPMSMPFSAVERYRRYAPAALLTKFQRVSG